MNSSDTSNNDYGSNVPMRWAANRIASFSILVILLLGALAYGIYSIVNNSTASAPATTIAKQSPPKTTPTKQPANSATQPATNSPTQLTNTGPGETALIGFTIATLIGTGLHYAWRKLTRSGPSTTPV